MHKHYASLYLNITQIDVSYSDKSETLSMKWPGVESCMSHFLSRFKGVVIVIVNEEIKIKHTISVTYCTKQLKNTCMAMDTWFSTLKNRLDADDYGCPWAIARPIYT